MVHFPYKLLLDKFAYHNCGNNHKKEIPEFLDIRAKTKELHNYGFTDFIPFLSIIGNGVKKVFATQS